MGRRPRLRGRTVALVAAIVTLTSLSGGGVTAATRDEPARRAPDPGIEARVNGLLAKMTLGEKLQQLQLLSDGQITDADAKNGVGAVFSLTDPQKINHLQHVAVEQSRLH